VNPTLAYLACRNVLMGGEYYRATRPAALLNREFGWGTAVCDRMATTIDNDGGPLSFVTPDDVVVTPDIIILRPIAEWRQHWNDQAHENGQLVVADLDDDVFAHPIWDSDELPPEDFYDEWIWNVDAVLVSTKYLKKRLEELGHKAPVYVAPNCFDSYGLDAHPGPGRIMGTRLWISGRMRDDLHIYSQCFEPLLEALDLMWMHLGAEPGHTFADEGWNADRLIERPSMAIPLFPKALQGLSIGAIAMSDHPYNLAKTETHAAELGAMGVPLVAASRHILYRRIPGRVDPTPEAVRERVEALLNPIFWRGESATVRAWARRLAIKNEAQHLSTVYRMVDELRRSSVRDLMAQIK